MKPAMKIPAIILAMFALLASSAPAMAEFGDIPAPPAPLEFVPLRPVLFEHDVDALDERASPLLEDLALFVRDNPRVQRILIKGYADIIADGAYNDALSQRRSEAVRARLVELGVPARLLHISAHGKSAPADEEWTSEGRSRNRRVELYLVVN